MNIFLKSKLNKTIRKILSIVIPLGIGVLIIWWALSTLTPSDKIEIKKAFLSADYFWIGISVVIALLSHLSRAYRWKYLLQPLGYKPRFINSVFAIFISYLVNLAIPRAGEVVRATTISKYEAIPFEKVFGTIVAERVVDMVILIGIIIGAFFFQVSFFKSLFLQKIPDQPLLLISLGILAVSFGLAFLYYIGRSKHRFFKKIRRFFNGLWEGMTSIWTMEHRGAFIAHSLFIWGMYLLMFYTASLSMESTSHLSFGAIISGFIGGTFGVTANGGLGTFPLAVKEVLSLYGVNANEGWAFGWLLWSTETILVLVLGVISLIGIPLYNKKFFKA
ncbi:MAG: TIGR00374 family protein [Flavobacteriales bacterium]|nr:MAG: TIGR00374 family protein [Flavobacteriales bacterium]